MMKITELIRDHKLTKQELYDVIELREQQYLNKVFVLKDDRYKAHKYNLELLSKYEDLKVLLTISTGLLTIALVEIFLF